MTGDENGQDLHANLIGMTPAPIPSDKDLPEAAITLAAELLDEANRGQTRSEKAQARQMARLMSDGEGKRFTFAMADQVFRAPTAAR